MHTFSCYIFRDKGLYVYTQFCVLIKEIHGHTQYIYIPSQPFTNMQLTTSINV